MSKIIIGVKVQNPILNPNRTFFLDLRHRSRRIIIQRRERILRQAKGLKEYQNLQILELIRIIQRYS